MGVAVSCHTLMEHTFGDGPPLLYLIRKAVRSKE